MLNTPQNGVAGKSPLAEIVENDDGATFYTLFNNTLNSRTGACRILSSSWRM